MPAVRTFRFRFDWKLTLLVLLLLPLLLYLGFWQLSREAEKLQIQTVYEMRRQEAPVALSALDASADLQYRQVEIEGEYDNAHTFLLDNRIYQGQVGYELIVPFVSNTGLVVFVNRGWTAQGLDRNAPVPTNPVTGVVKITGSVYVPLGAQLTLGDTSPGNEWPKVIQGLDPQQLATLSLNAAPERVFPYSIRLSELAPGVLQRNWPVISTSPEKHRAYAVQWFAMAAALLLLYFYYSCRPVKHETVLNPSEDNSNPGKDK